MRNSIPLAAIPPALAIVGGVSQPAHAASIDFRTQQLHSLLQAAVCQNDWEAALTAIAPMIGSPESTVAEREHLIQFRADLLDWQASEAVWTGTDCQAIGVEFAPIAPAENQRVQVLYSELQGALCRSDWSSALTAIGPLIGSSGISTSYREHLIHLRQQIMGWRAAQSVLSNEACRAPIQISSL